MNQSFLRKIKIDISILYFNRIKEQVQEQEERRQKRQIPWCFPPPPSLSMPIHPFRRGSALTRHTHNRSPALLLCCPKLSVMDLTTASVSSFRLEGNFGRLCHLLRNRICLTCPLPKSQMFIYAMPLVLQRTAEHDPTASLICLPVHSVGCPLFSH